MKTYLCFLIVGLVIALGKIAFSQTIPVSENKQFAASSVLKASNVANYNPSNVFDFTQQTAWVEGVKGSGVGEWIAIYLGKLEELGDISEPAVTIYPGYQKDWNSLTNNGIPSKLKIELFLNDKMIGSSVIDPESKGLSLTRIETEISCEKFSAVKGIVWLKVTILKVQKGKKWDDTAISEIYCNFRKANPHKIKETINRFCQGVMKKNAASIKEFTNQPIKKIVEAFTNEFMYEADPTTGPDCSNDPIICSEGTVYLFATEGGDGASFAKFVWINGKWSLKGFNYFNSF